MSFSRVRKKTGDSSIKNQVLAENFPHLSTPLIVDAALRLEFSHRIAPPGISPVIRGSRIAGRVLPAKHFGSVDVFLEAMQVAGKGDVLVIDNGGGRTRCLPPCGRFVESKLVAFRISRERPTK